MRTSFLSIAYFIPAYIHFGIIYTFVITDFFRLHFAESAHLLHRSIYIPWIFFPCPNSFICSPKAANRFTAIWIFDELEPFMPIDSGLYQREETKEGKALVQILYQLFIYCCIAGTAPKILYPGI